MADARPPRKPSFVLLVDADAESRDMYAEFLRHASWRVDTAADGASALAKVIGEHPDVIVSELRLPSISGYELIRILQADPATRAIPIVVVTGDAFATDVDRARGCGASLVLTKPCVPETLRESLQAVLDAVRSGAHPGTAHAGAAQTGGRRRPARASLRAAPPPALFCPECSRPLVHVRSVTGGVSAKPEQWDYYRCASGCGQFQYRHRTQKLRRVS